MISREQLQLPSAIAISAVLPLQLLQTRQELWITNNLPAAFVFTHVSQIPIGIDDQGVHGGDWRRLVEAMSSSFMSTQSASSKRTSPKP